jgi:CRISPR/Cas system-associated endoribonuclease Cas2
LNLRDKFQGGVGERFFEGIINIAFLKKLKKRLHELLEDCQSSITKLKAREESNREENVAENVGIFLEYFQNCFT